MSSSIASVPVPVPEHAASLEDDATFLARMNAKQLDPSKPTFTYEEVARCWRIVMNEPIEGNEDFLAGYCVPYFNTERDHACFFK